VLVGNWRSWRWVNAWWFRIAHLAAIGVVAAQAWGGVVCPLTTLEMWFRVQAGKPAYAGGFIEHWLQWLLYYDAPPWPLSAAQRKGERSRYDPCCCSCGGRIMVRFMHRVSIGFLSGLLAMGACAGAGEKAQSTAKAASGVAVKTENAVKRGLGAAASGVERGAQAAGNAVTHVAKQIGVPGAGASAPKQPQSTP
jgi:hypothetical protein